MVNFISEDTFTNIKNKFFSTVFEILDDTEKIVVSNHEETSIGIFNENYKIISAMIAVVKLLFDTQKLIFLCDNTLVNLIIQSVFIIKELVVKDYKRVHK